MRSYVCWRRFLAILLIEDWNTVQNHESGQGTVLRDTTLIAAGAGTKLAGN